MSGWEECRTLQNIWKGSVGGGGGSVCRGRGNIVDSRIFIIVILPLTFHSNKTG